MNLEELVKIIQDMALQHDYPGCDLRVIKFGLPKETERCPAKVFASALRHDDVVVRLAAIRWFASRNGVIKQHKDPLLACLEDKDDWVRLESVPLLEYANLDPERLCPILQKALSDPFVEVRRIAVKTAGRIGKTQPDERLIAVIKEAENDQDAHVRARAQKALRKLGVYSS